MVQGNKELNITATFNYSATKWRVLLSTIFSLIRFRKKENQIMVDIPTLSCVSKTFTQAYEKLPLFKLTEDPQSYTCCGEL